MANASTNGQASANRVTKLHIKPAKVTPAPDSVEVYSIEKQVIATSLIGASPLIVNNFNTKSVAEIEDMRRLSAEEKRGQKRAPRPPVIPEERYMLARVLDEEGRDCIPARWIKAALVTAATRYGEIGVNGQIVRGALFVLGDLLPIKFKPTGTKSTTVSIPDGKRIDLSGQLAELEARPTVHPYLRRDVVRVGKFPNKQPDLRYRPAYHDWSIDLRIEYEPSLISLAGLHQLIRRAGTSVGLCEWRPEKSHAGTFGRFDIAAGSAEARARS